MSLFNAFTYRQPVPSGTVYDLSGDVIGTLDFGVPYRPIFCREVVPGDNWKIKLSAFTRLSAMVLPTFGRIKVVNRFFYVPMTVIHDSWNEFMSGQDISVREGSTLSRITPACITMDNRSMCEAFTKASTFSMYDGVPLVEQLSDSATKYDFVWRTSASGTDHKYVFKKRGRQVFNVLLGLGLLPRFKYSDVQPFSAMPLLAYAKVCYDWLVDSNFVNSIDFEVQGLFKRNYGLLSNFEIYTILRIFSTCYEKDYFTSAWQSPNQVDSSQFGNPFSGSIDIGGGFNSISNESFTGPTLSEYHEADKFTQVGLDTLKSLASWVRRRLFTGFRIDKQMESTYGLKMDSEDARRSYYLGSVEVNVNISDVMSTAQTTNSDVVTHLGEYAGKGIGYEDGYITFENDKPVHGYLLCLSAIVPDTAIVSGRSRETFHINREDFFDPTFDIFSPQAIRNDELDLDWNNIDSDSPYSIFGYAPRFAEYKSGAQTNKLLGDFRFPTSNNGSMDAFHLFRSLRSDDGTMQNFTNNYSFKTTADSDQFRRIFAISDTMEEHFNLIWHFEIKCFRRGNPINDLSQEYGRGKIDQMKHSDDLLHG